jgi:hypothetical protein
VVEDVTNLKNANIVLEFDASKLQYVSSTAGSFIPNSFLFEQNIDNINGSINLAIIAALGDSNYASGSGTIMTVIFERIASGNTNITFGTTELKDKDNNIITHTTGSGCSFVGCLGDFGSVGGGPPDGYVDFEDLMIFSMAYGSTPSDSNWNPSCDIAGPGGTLTPDGVIDFEDLMIFAIHYGDICGECTLPAAPILSDPGSSLTSPATYTVDWNEVSEATSYVLQESTSSGFSGAQEYNVSDNSRNFSHTVSSTTTYYYRVAAVNSCGQSGWSNVENIEIEVAPSGGAKWTIMVYMDGDNNLDDCAWDDLSELESVSSTDEIKIVTQLDAYYSCSGTFRYYITGSAPGTSYPLYPDDIVQTLPEQNMADPATLTSFVNWATTNYPAEKYLLVLWNHGAGWRDSNIPTKGVIWDETSGGDYLTMAELVQGLDGINEGIDIIGFDACLMQMTEVAYEINGLTNIPNYMVGSQASEWGDGWPYDDILTHLLANPGMTDAVLCETIVNDFINYCGIEGTLSVLDFSTGTYDTYTTLNSFATALMASSYQNEIAAARSSAQSYSYSSGYRCKDIYDFAERIKNSVPDCQSEALAVMNQVNDFVLFEAHTGSGVVNSHGLSIYLPDNAGEYDNDYNNLQFGIDTQWDEFLQGGGVVPPSSSVYRAFLVGVGDYQYFPDIYGNTDLPSPPFDVDRMHDTLNHSARGFSLINELIDLQATKTAILNGIATAFSGADADDVSYFYFSGHGMNSNGVSYLCPTNVSYFSPLSAFISTNELENALSVIPGTKVVIFDCCHSGGFIGKQISEEGISTNPQDFNSNVINVFLSRDLTGSQYKVLTSCHSSQVCVELIPAEGDPFGLFSGVLCEGCGYDYYTHPYSADGNGNGEITLQEAYTYTDEQVTIIATALNDLYGWNIDQDTQVYPLNSDFIIIEE